MDIHTYILESIALAIESGQFWNSLCVKILDAHKQLLLSRDEECNLQH